MINIEKQIAYWRSGAEEDWAVAEELVERGRARHGLFFAHLALEKVLKAHVCKHTRDLAPRIHDLARLAELAELPLELRHRTALGDLSVFRLEGQYPRRPGRSPSPDQSRDLMSRSGEVLEWLMSRL